MSGKLACSLWLMSLSVFGTHCAILSSQECNNTVFINDKYYASEILLNISGIPADISVNWQSNNLFYTLISDAMKMSLHVLTGDMESRRISVDGLGQSSAVDNVNNVVYLATDTGVYKLDEGSWTTTLYAAPGEDVMYIAPADNGRTLYIATWPQNLVRKLTDNGRRSEPFPPVLNGHGITVDSQNNIYYEAVKTPYLLKHGDTMSIRITGLRDTMVDFCVTKTGEVFAMDEHSNLYRIDPGNAAAGSLGSFGLEDVNTFAIDGKGNIIIGAKDYLGRWLVQEKNPCK